eukprot:scaffold34096_cov67-Isochrysis_galbana.AAC.1
MDEAQSLFDRYAMPVCPSQLTAPNLHRVLGHAPLRKHIWGAKGVGSQASKPPYRGLCLLGLSVRGGMQGGRER